MDHGWPLGCRPVLSSTPPDTITDVLKSGSARGLVLLTLVLSACAYPMSASGSGTAGPAATITGTAAAGAPRGLCAIGGGAFNLPMDNPNPHGSTPQAALDATLAHGSIFGAVPPSRAPGEEGYPANGWHPTKASSGTAASRQARPNSTSPKCQTGPGS
jgi:hypothetical protein